MHSWFKSKSVLITRKCQDLTVVILSSISLFALLLSLFYDVVSRLNILLEFRKSQNLTFIILSKISFLLFSTSFLFLYSARIQKEKKVSLWSFYSDFLISPLLISIICNEIPRLYILL